jgi:hypothetical protein
MGWQDDEDWHERHPTNDMENLRNRGLDPHAGEVERW